MKKLAIIGDYSPTNRSHIATNVAVEHSCSRFNLKVAHEWVSTTEIHEALLQGYDGFWIAPGSPYKHMDNAIWAIKYARENRIPTLGTCGGFQHMILEAARNILGFQDAQHAEYDPYASRLFIARLECSLAGRELELCFAEGSFVASVYRSARAIEQYHCNFGVNPEYVSLLKKTPLHIVGWDEEGGVRVIELPGHPFFVGTLYVPQMLSTAEKPHPLVTAFLGAV